jgi:hypothetical protein
MIPSFAHAWALSKSSRACSFPQSESAPEAFTKFNIDSIPAACTSSLARSGTLIEFMIECLPKGNEKP